MRGREDEEKDFFSLRNAKVFSSFLASGETRAKNKHVVPPYTMPRSQ